MKAYGILPLMWLDEEYGPRSRFRSKTRTKRHLRRCLHKIGRRGQKRVVLMRMLEDGE